MEVSFDTRLLRDSCSEDVERQYGLHAEALMARLADLEAAPNLAALPIGVEWADISLERVIIRVDNGCRLICRADRTSIRLNESEEPDWPRVNRIYVVSIELDGVQQ